MKKVKSVVIGCGKAIPDKDAQQHGISHTHALGYLATPDCKMVACADIVEEYAQAFAKIYEVPNYYLDYKEMIEKEKPDIVSICTWPGLHAEMAIHAAKAGVKAIHCEKPMAATFGEARKMKAACEKAGAQLTFNHQRRFEPQYRYVRDLANQGAIGKIQRIETCAGNMYDWGTHWFDMMNFYNNDVPAEWVLGQIDSRSESGIFGVDMENQGLAQIKYSNGVYGLMLTGSDQTLGGGCEHRIIGTEGIIEAEMPVVRVRGKGNSKMKTVEFPDDPPIGAWSAITYAIWDVIHCMKTGREPELSARKAFAATEFIFATYESSRRRGRVDLPLEIDDNPLHAMMKAGEIGPNRKG
jgi:UDP-N-acetylglucosamine 3-dehydrogenase